MLDKVSFHNHFNMSEHLNLESLGLRRSCLRDQSKERFNLLCLAYAEGLLSLTE